ncbi:MAG: hypothetical protein IJB17_04155 [Oscillospiraceae bacterium]|nr:hypothetical protein [Oscillospiraceae bacterium]
MSFCTYLASDALLAESGLLWRLSRGAEDIYTDKRFTAQIDPGLTELSAVLDYIQKQVKTSGELEIWHIWQGIESTPLIRSRRISVEALTVEDLLKLQREDVFAGATRFDIPIQYRIVVTK